ncbi:MAG: hypothetical protein A2Z11_01245 [Candidatus Woykebacteria bacterium RBG_16_43_9]|uniref:DUF6922 domain-containing protein n=1 Tax=Candidatus Woykebacteria bacterium RBG_16_43_9 TaxID=1802596 RepID=A0A1G1WER4_9BACT|nr:MAG: hypothetical protein A2Z11_01245 [Candidatus Woykebacteria bacterium RBG_16_43_9]
MKKIPKEFQKYFWDVAINSVDAEKYSRYVIERLLEYGDKRGVSWLVITYPKESIISVLKISRNLSTKSANFWSKIYNIPVEEIRCLKVRSTQLQERTWPY